MKPILTNEQIAELERTATDAISLMIENPQAFTGSPEEIWRQHFEWMEGPGHLDSAGSGDCGTPSWDDCWREDHLETEITRTKEGEEILRFYHHDSEGDCETDAEIKKVDLSEPWAREELVSECLYRHSIYVLLKQQLYNLDCIRTGRDPLRWVHPERRQVLGTVDVTLRKDGTTSATLVNGSPAVIGTATRYVAYQKNDPREFDTLEDILKELPNGRPLSQDEDRSRGWMPLAHDPGKSATLRVQVCDTVQKCSARHIREVFSKDAAEEVQSYAKTVAKTLQKPSQETELPDDLPPDQGPNCPHGNPWGDCGRCDHEGDLAYDAARERGCR